MKQQFRFILAGFSLIGVLVYHAIPAEAQALNTKFTVTLVTLSLTVTPPQVALGSKGGGLLNKKRGRGNPSAVLYHEYQRHRGNRADRCYER